MSSLNGILTEDDEELAKIRNKKKRALEKFILQGKTTQGQGLHAGDVIDLNLMNFDEIIKKSDRIIVDFWSPTCVPCRLMEPVFKKLALEYRGKVTFGKINVSANSLIASRYGVMAVPTFLLFKMGRPVYRFSGAVGEASLKNTINRFLQ
ncbi:MAG: thioredoxin family protein [Candidatus Helarchaeota archaeon]